MTQTMRFRNIRVFFSILRVYLTVYDDLEDLQEIIRKDIIESDKAMMAKNIKDLEPSMLLIKNDGIEKIKTVLEKQSAFHFIEIDEKKEFDDFLELFLENKKKEARQIEEKNISQNPTVLIEFDDTYLKTSKSKSYSKARNLKQYQILKDSKIYFDIEVIKKNFKRDRQIISKCLFRSLIKSPSIAKSDDNSLEKWGDIVDAIFGIFEIAYMFFFSESFYFLYINDVKSLTTVDEIDKFIKRAIEEFKSKKMVLNSEINLKFIHFYLNNSVQKEPFNIGMSMKTLCCAAKTFLKEKNVRELLNFLLHEIRNNKMKLREINSLFLVLFCKYVVENNRIDNLYDEVPFLISKIIVLINLANTEYKYETDSNMDKYIDRINLLISKCLISFLFKKGASMAQNKIDYTRRKILQVFQKYPQFECPLQPNNLIFFSYLIGKNIDITDNFVFPTIRLSETEELRLDLSKIGFHYLLRAIKYTYELGEILAQQKDTSI